MPEKNLNIVSFAGSLRKESISRRVLKSSIELTPSAMTITELGIEEIPMFNADLEDAGTPEVVVALKKSVANSDGLLIVTPEYNNGIPGVTKNIIDWLSRKNSEHGNVLSGLPIDIIAIAGGSTGSANLVRTQIRQVLVYPGAVPMPNGDIGLSGKQLVFNHSGQLTGETFIDQVRKNLDDFADWIYRLSN